MRRRATHFATAFSLSLASFFLLVLVAVPSRALDPDLNVSQYAHTAWRVQDGYFSSAPRTMTQTSDGYLWIGTQSGLVRFDGSRFLPWTPPDGKSLPSSTILSLLGAHDGSLWIGTRAGLAHFVNQKLVQFPDFHDRVYGILEDSSGNIWISHQNDVEHSGGPICEVSGTTIHCLDKSDGVSESACCGGPLVKDGSGNLWVGTDRDILRWRAGSSQTFRPAGLGNTDGLEGVTSLAAEPDGSIWVGAQLTRKGGLQLLTDGSWKSFSLPHLDSIITALLRDPEGGLWVGTVSQGIYHIHGRHVDRFRGQDGLSSNFVFCFYADREGGIWAVTNKGVDSFHPLQMVTFSRAEGLSSDNVVSVVVSRDNTIWLASSSSLDAIRDGAVSSVRSGDGLPGSEVTTLFCDHTGRLWVGVDNDLFTYTNKTFHRVRRENGSSTQLIVGLTEDSQHNIWAEVSGSNRELIRIENLMVVEEFPEKLVPSARALAGDLDNGIWLGLRSGDLARFRNGHVEVFSIPHGVNSPVRQVLVNSDGSVFGATTYGLIGWRNGQSRALTSRNGLLCDGIIGMNWDNHGDLWLYTECGLLRIEKADVQRWWTDQDVHVAPTVFDVFDGVQPGIPDFNPAAKSSDGKLWFANQVALQMIDPRHLTRNEIPPPVHIEDVVADHKTLTPVEGLQLPPLTRDLEIDYTALSFVKPKKMRFRYRLEGRDTTWQEAGTRRQAFYNDLRPGQYRFRVIASNNDGVWNEQGATLTFDVAPAWYQRSAFRIFLTGVGLLGVWCLYQFRIRQATRAMHVRFDERLAERTRLARELHDTLLQSFQALMLRFQAVSNLLPTRPIEAKRRLDGSIDEAAEAITEGRRAVQGLRSSSTPSGDVASAVSALGEELAPLQTDQNSPAFQVETEGMPRDLRPMLRDDVYRIAGEALRNAFQHAQARHIEVEIRYDERRLRLRIRDDGKGIDPQVLNGSGRVGHWGLAGMRERAKLVGGKLEVWSSLGSGTEIELTVPASIAYIGSATGLRSWFYSRGA